MKLSEKMTTTAERIRGHYLGTTHASELLLEYAPEVAKLEEVLTEVGDYFKHLGMDSPSRLASRVFDALLSGADDD